MSRTLRTASATTMLTLLGVSLLAWLFTTPTQANDELPLVVRVEVIGEIDLGLPPYLARAIRDAERDGAEALILEIDTPGGRLDAVLQIRDLLLATDLRTVSFINTTAFSAGALVALASTDIVMAPGSVIGAATPVQGETGETASEKIISAVRSTFRATAVERDRDPTVAEAMVDAQVVIEGVTARGQLLTLTDREAAEVGFRDGSATTIDDVLTYLALPDARLQNVTIAPAERLARILTGSLIAPLLLSFGLIVLISNVLSGTIGIASLIGLSSIGLFVFGHLLAGLAGIEDVLLIFAGIVLIGIEVLVLPGFGIAGILGVVAIVSGATLAMLGRQLAFVDASDVVVTIGTLVLVFAVTLIAVIIVLTLLGSRRSSVDAPRNWRRWLGDGGVLADDSAKPPADAATALTYRPPKGAIGVALTDLRPSGVAEFDGRRTDVVTDGEYLDRDTPLWVVRSEQFRSVVARHHPHETAPAAAYDSPPPPPPHY